MKKQRKNPINQLNEEAMAQRILEFYLKNSSKKNCNLKLMEKLFENIQSAFGFSNQSLFYQPFCVLNFLFYDSDREAFKDSFQRNKKKTEALILQNCFGGNIDVKKHYKPVSHL
jgi:hypothetical protein